MPLEYGFTSADADDLQIVIGEPGKPMPLLVNANAPGIIHLPDRTTTFSSDAAGTKVFEKPDFHYFILRKQAAWATWGYSSALLVMWEGQPESIEALKDNGYGEIRFSYPRRNGRSGGKVWLYPFAFVNDADMEYIYRNAEHFLSARTLMHKGFPSQQLLNAIPAGLAAGAYLLTTYNDPCATTARIHAENAVDELFEGEENGKRLMRAFFPVRAAAWMVKLGKALGDERMVAKYTPLLDHAVKRMCSPELGYDGKGWPGGWDHFNSTKALWLAYDATGKEEYRQAHERALSVYTIDEKGIYRYGQRIAAPGGFDTYSGALALGVWGNAGMLDNVDKLINLDVPNGWYSELPVKDTWNDAGAGPWAQDDANPEDLGISLKGAHIPQSEKHVIPVGAVPVYHADGRVEITNQPIVENPFFRRGRDKPRVVAGNRTRIEHHVSTLVLTPGDAAEKAHLVRAAGKVEGGRRVCAGGDAPLVYRFDTAGAIGAGVNLHIRGNGYKMEVSPDGKRWYEQLDTWSGEFRDQSADLSYLTGGCDELLKMLVISPANDGKYLTNGSRSWVEQGNCRYVTRNGSFVYRLDLPGVAECHLEVLVGNGYRIECSPDGKAWHEELNAAKVRVRKGLKLEDAAWLQMLDVTPYLGRGGAVHLRFSDIGKPEVYGGRTAFLQRLAVYGLFDSDRVFVRLSNVTSDARHSFELDRLTFRTWKD
jgi:hypothetical protein